MLTHSIVGDLRKFLTWVMCSQRALVALGECAPSAFFWEGKEQWSLEPWQSFWVQLPTES
jgi:hypothetical protein